MKLTKYLVASTFLLSALGCGFLRSESTDAANREPQVSLPTAESTPTQIQAAAANTQPVASQDTPELLVRDLYRLHGEDFKGSKDRIINGKSRKYLDKYFDKNLADLIWKDITTHVGEVGVIDFDLFYAAQDADIKMLQVGRAEIKDDRASVAVSFTNFGTRERIVYKLAKENGAWKIADIEYKDGGTLLKYFKEGD